MNEETREALDAQSVDMDRIRADIRGLQEDVRLVLRKLNDMTDNSSSHAAYTRMLFSQSLRISICNNVAPTNIPSARK